MSKRALEDQVIVVIGGSSGLGLSAARAFLEAGAAGVVVTGRNEERVEEAVGDLGERAVGWPGDATRPDHADGAVARAVESFGKFDGLYHVAGGSGRRLGDGVLHEVTDEGVPNTLALNLNSVIYSNRAAVRQFHRQGGGGSILNMGSVLGWSPSPDYFATHVYAAAKSAIIGFTRSIAARYARDGIRANVLAPGLVETPMARRAAEDEGILAFIRTKQPLDGGRIGRASDLDSAAVYFLSAGAAFTTGQVLAVDGGWEVTEGQLQRGPAREGPAREGPAREGPTGDRPAR